MERLKDRAGHKLRWYTNHRENTIGLKLTVSKHDKIVLSNGVVIDVRSTSDKQTTLEFTAPRDVEINAVFQDSKKQFKNLNKDR
jgi:hypothetical protein